MNRRDALENNLVCTTEMEVQKSVTNIVFFYLLILLNISIPTWLKINVSLKKKFSCDSKGFTNPTEVVFFL